MSEHHKTAWGQPRPRFAVRYLEASPTHFSIGYVTRFAEVAD